MTLGEAPHISWGTRMRGLDGIRCLAVIAVIAAHSHVSWMHGGGLGVDMFFVLSGFLITGLLLNEYRQFGRVSVPKFWGRRLLRLMPALIVLIICVDAVAILFPAKLGGYAAAGLAATPSILFYFSNWLIVAQNGAALGPFGPLWSLSVEEQFYLLWPLVTVVVLRWRNPLRWLAIIAAGGCVAVTVFRFLAFDPANLYPTFGTNYRVDMLLMGCLLAIAFQAGLWTVIRRVSRFAVYPAIAYLIVIAILTPEFNVAGANTKVYLYYTVGLPLLALSMVAIIGRLVTAQQSRLASVLSVKPISYLGRISYGMYLWHYPIILVLQVRFQPDPNIVFIVSLLLTVAAASASWFLVERPLSRTFHSRLLVRSPARDVFAPEIPASRG